MPINKETIISVFDEKLTLMQWLKTINKTLEDAVLTGVEINKKGNATLSFKFLFEDGTYLETGDLVLQQGESVNGAYIQNGHLYLTLTNSQTLDAGNVKPVSSFSIDASQHLIVNYGDGTNQDLGAIFSGNVVISGTFEQTQANYATECAIERSADTISKGITKTDSYSKIIKINGMLYIILHFALTNPNEEAKTLYNIGSRLINLPSAIASKLYDFDGSPASEIVGTPCMITMGTLAVSKSKSNNSDALEYVNFGVYHADHPSGNRINLSVAQASGLTIPAGATRYFSGRFSLTLIE